MLNDLWTKVLLHFQGALPKETYDLWLLPIKPVSLENGLLTLNVPNKIHSIWLEKNAKTQILECLKPEESGILSIEFTWHERAHLKESPAFHMQRSLARPETTPASEGVKSASLLQPRYSFDRFIVGPTN
ncbi:MAG: DnaA N-terminal domain-containing protein, partial [Elusimicrobiota bacterium]